jgi:hypothetical protein
MSKWNSENDIVHGERGEGRGGERGEERRMKLICKGDILCKLFTYVCSSVS